MPEAAAARARLLEVELARIVGEPDPEPAPSPDPDAARAEEILAEARALLGLGANAPLPLIQAAFAQRGGFHFFWRFFFPHYQVHEATGEALPGPAMQDALVELVDYAAHASTAVEEAIACPREHGKSVVVSVAGTCYVLATGLRKFGILFNVVRSGAESLLGDVLLEVEGNERLAAVFPEFCTLSRKPSARRLEMANGAMLWALGAGSAVRGARKGRYRPDWIVLDDIEKDEEVLSSRRRERKWSWYHKVVRKLGRGAPCLIVGTILHARSFLARKIADRTERVHRAIVKYPDELGGLWKQWEKLHHLGRRAAAPAPARRRIPGPGQAAGARGISWRRVPRRTRWTDAAEFYLAHRQRMDAGAVLQWPERFTLLELMIERADDYASFLSERQNDPFDPGACWFPEAEPGATSGGLIFVEPPSMPPPAAVRFSLLAWDPSAGTSRGDTSAAPRMDVLHDGRRLVSEAICGRIPAEEVMDGIVGMHVRRRFLVIGVEKVGLSTFEEQLRSRGRGRGMELPVQPYTPTTDKGMRIKGQRPLVIAGTLIFAASLPLEAREQLAYYPQHAHDDFWDAVAALNRLADELTMEVVAASVESHTMGDAPRLSAGEAFGRATVAGVGEGEESVSGPGIFGRLGGLIERVFH
jgi:predicted phage terminase large subunit-like protein